MDKPWLSQYPAGVPAEIDIQQFSSLVDMLAATCTRFGDLPAYRSMGTAMSFRELDGASHASAAWLQKNTDLQRGDRVALMMPNLLQYPVALFGVLRAGMTRVVEFRSEPLPKNSIGKILRRELGGASAASPAASVSSVSQP